MLMKQSQTLLVCWFFVFFFCSTFALGILLSASAAWHELGGTGQQELFAATERVSSPCSGKPRQIFLPKQFVFRAGIPKTEISLLSVPACSDQNFPTTDLGSHPLTISSLLSPLSYSATDSSSQKTETSPENPVPEGELLLLGAHTRVCHTWRELSTP